MTDRTEDHLAWIEAKLQPERIRSTLPFAGLHQMTHGLIQQAVLNELHEIYFSGLDERGTRYDEARYRAEVLDRDPKSKFRASLLWRSTWKPSRWGRRIG